MGSQVDAVNPANIPAELDGKVAARCSVLAAPGADVYDLETGNAPAAEVATAVAGNIGAGRACVIYVNQSTQQDALHALAVKELRFSSSAAWPAAGVYLAAADPDVTPGEIPAWCAAPPVFVQDQFLSDHDISTTFGAYQAEVLGYIDGPESEWPAAAWERFAPMWPDTAAHPTEPVPPVEPSGGNVNLPTLSPGATGGYVKGVQRLVGDVAVDGIFGPVTESAVRNFQTAAHIGVDGIVGPVTWAALLDHD